MNYNLKENMRFHFVFKIITLVFLIWIHHPYHYKYHFDKTLEKKSKHDSIIDIDFNRLLAQREFKKQLGHSSLNENLPDYSKIKEIKNEKYISTYGHVKKGKVNNLDAYRREYKNRYRKKKGLAKLDCYYEKKIFDKIEQVHDLAKKFIDDKKSYKKEIYRRYGYLLITFALLPLLGLVIPVFFSKLNPFIKNWCLSDCRYKHDGSKGNSINYDTTPEDARALIIKIPYLWHRLIGIHAI
ncbi:Plasmodium exported protein, unknown function [Plasmodium vivax]|uniref:Variable surface protein Vir35 n=1 Tax=Plasmodium vivax TaxID=5855 RepID=A0A565A6H9_PLAVI|nr:Plasmodium exported protein, unknown function [Plasmodium vivax]